MPPSPRHSGECVSANTLTRLGILHRAGRRVLTRAVSLSSDMISYAPLDSRVDALAGSDRAHSGCDCHAPARRGLPVPSVFPYVGRCADRILVKLKVLLAPFWLRRFYTDGWWAYHRHLEPQLHVVGKQRTPQLERKLLTLGTRIKRLGGS